MNQDRRSTIAASTANRVSLYLAQPTPTAATNRGTGGWMPWQLLARLPARRGNISLYIPFYRTTLGSPLFSIYKHPSLPKTGGFAPFLHRRKSNDFAKSARTHPRNATGVLSANDCIGS